MTFRNFVLNDIEYEEENEFYGYAEDVANYGCVSGVATSLIYNKDVKEVYDNYKEEILMIVKNYYDEVGIPFEDIYRTSGSSVYEAILYGTEYIAPTWAAYEILCREYVMNKENN